MNVSLLLVQSTEGGGGERENWQKLPSSGGKKTTSAFCRLIAAQDHLVLENWLCAQGVLDQRM